MSFQHLLNQNCIYHIFNDQDEYGDFTHLDGINKRCRFARSGLKLQQTSNGEISQKSSILWIDNTIAPYNNDKVVFNGVDYLVKYVDEWVNKNGTVLGYKLTIEEYV